MAELESELFSLLSTSTLVTTLCGTRIYPVTAPQNVTLPFLVYTRISGGQVNHLTGYATLQNPRIQIDVYSTGYSQVKTLKTNVHTVMETAIAFKSLLISDNDLFEDDIGAYRESMDFSCWYRA